MISAQDKVAELEERLRKLEEALVAQRGHRNDAIDELWTWENRVATHDRSIELITIEIESTKAEINQWLDPTDGDRA